MHISPVAPKKKIKFQSRSSICNRKLKKQMTMSTTIHMVICFSQTVSTATTMCHKYFIRSQTPVNFEKYCYIHVFTFCICTRPKWLNSVILQQPILSLPLVTEMHWAGRGSLCGWCIWSCYKIYHRIFQAIHNLLHGVHRHTCLQTCTMQPLCNTTHCSPIIHHTTCLADIVYMYNIHLTT